MIHGLNNTFLYSAKKIVAIWTKGKRSIASQGTGFFISEGDRCIALVTNRHVIEPGYTGHKYRKFELAKIRIETLNSVDGGIPTKLDSAEIDRFVIDCDDNWHNDVACISGFSIAGRFEVSFPIPYGLLASEEWINTKLSVCDTIAYPGFPEWFDHKKNAPIFRMGTIASDPRGDYSRVKNEPEASRIAYEGFSSGGASGSPVFATQKGFNIGEGLEVPEGFYREVKLIGINAGHFGGKEGHSGISYFYKSSVIKSIIDRKILRSPPSS